MSRQIMSVMTSHGSHVEARGWRLSLFVHASSSAWDELGTDTQRSGHGSLASSSRYNAPTNTSSK